MTTTGSLSLWSFLRPSRDAKLVWIRVVLCRNELELLETPAGGADTTEEVGPSERPTAEDSPPLLTQCLRSVCLI